MDLIKVKVEKALMKMSNVCYGRVNKLEGARNAEEGIEVEHFYFGESVGTVSADKGTYSKYNFGSATDEEQSEVAGEQMMRRLAVRQRLKADLEATAGFTVFMALAKTSGR